MSWYKREWFPVDNPLPEYWAGTELNGDPNAWPRTWTQLWRFQWKWRVLKINDQSEVGQIPDHLIYFKSGDLCMIRRPPVTTRYIGVRIGSGPVTFYAATESAASEGGGVQLEDTGWYGSKEELEQNLGARRALRRHGITYI